LAYRVLPDATVFVSPLAMSRGMVLRSLDYIKLKLPDLED